MSGPGTFEPSVEGNLPREVFDIVINGGVTTYRHTSANRDVVHNGQTYTTLAMDRSEQAITMPGEERDMTMSLPIDHPLARRFPVSSQPPMKITVTVTRVYPDGSSAIIWIGDVAAMAVDGGVAKFLIPSRAGVYMLRSVPSVQVGRACTHMVYDSMCGAERTGSAAGSGFTHTQTVTVTAIDGRDITVDLVNVTASHAYRATWAEHGEVYHAATGERMTVLKQQDLAPGTGTVTKLTMSGVIVGLTVGMSVVVYAGCDWALQTCHEKFNAKDTFGGMPYLPMGNPFVYNTRGQR